jgi:hypothetical protein
MHVQRLDLEILSQMREKLPIGAGRIAVRMRKMQQGFGHFFRLWRPQRSTSCALPSMSGKMQTIVMAWSTICLGRNPLIIFDAIGGEQR